MAFENFKRKKVSEIIAQTTTRGRDPYRKIPAVLRLGKKATEQKGFFDYNGVIQDFLDKSKGSSDYEDNSIILQEDPITGEISVMIKDTVFKKNFLKHIDQTINFSTKAKTEISKSFFNQIGTAISAMPVAERYVQILAIPFETGSLGTTGLISPVSASISLLEAPGLAYNIDGSPRERKIKYFNTSSFFTNSHFFFNFDELNSTSNFGDTEQAAATTKLVNASLTHLTRSFTHFTNQDAQDHFFYIQPSPVKTFSIEMTSSHNTASFFALTSSFSSAADFGVTSGSFIGKIIDSASINQPRFYNGTTPGGAGASGDNSDGAWSFVVQKAIIEGEGEFSYGETSFGGEIGDNVAFTPQQLVVWYPTKYNYSNVRSASYYFTPYPTNMNKLPTGPTTKNLITGSISSSEEMGTGELRTVYWLNHTYTSSFTASFGNFTRHELKTNYQGTTSNHQLPYMNQSLRFFGQKQTSNNNSSHLWKDTALSQPADQGYYIHSSSFSSQSKANMANLLGSENHTSSFFVMGSFIHPFLTLTSELLQKLNYTASQVGEPATDGNSWMNHHTIASCMFLKRHDDQVFLFNPKNGQNNISESVG